MHTKEKITHEAHDDSAWICNCNNTPSGDGFYPCDTFGREIEPTNTSGWQGLYVCNRCKRIIRVDTLEVTGIAR